MKHKRKITAAAILATAGLFAASAIAQQQGQTQPPPAASETPPAPPSGSAPRDGAWGGGIMGRGGLGLGMSQRGQGLSEADRTAFFEARLAAVKAGLMLTEAQQRLWPAVETALRERMKLRQEWAERIRKEGQLSNPIDRMKRAGEMMSARGGAMTRMAEAMKPFHESLTDDQKRRLRVLMRMGGTRQGAAPHSAMRGEFRQRWQQQGGWQRRGDDDRPRWREGRRGSRDSDRDAGEGRRWNQDAPDSSFGLGDEYESWRRM